MPSQAVPQVFVTRDGDTVILKINDVEARFNYKVSKDLGEALFKQGAIIQGLTEQKE